MSPSCCAEWKLNITTLKYQIVEKTYDKTNMHI